MTCKACINNQCTYKTLCIDGVHLIIKSEDINGSLHVENPKTGINSIVYPNLKKEQKL